MARDARHPSPPGSRPPHAARRRYLLFSRSRLIPRVIPAFGLAAVSVGLVGAVLALLGSDVGLIPYLPILPFEVTIGTWLLVRGTGETSKAPTANDYQPNGREAAAPPA